MDKKSILTCDDRLPDASHDGGMADKTDPRLELAKTLGRDIKRARVRAGLSQAALGELVGVSRQAVSMWEKGINVPEGYRIRQLHEQINLSPQENDRIGLGVQRPDGPPKEEMVRTSVAVPMMPGSDWFTIEDLGEAYSAKPPALGPMDWVSCVLVGNNTMSPWRFPHDPIFYHFLADARVGDHVLVAFKTSPSVREITRSTPFAIKLLTGLGQDFVRLKQYFPDEEETWPKQEILTIYPIIEWKDLYGPFPLV